ncbi:MAG: alpha-glucosidase C-terminal domain-containing protein, partial [Thermomicrobiales bacterium]|nr:alpha-glucosidase C-terminal domain-containing protein [Thermomicrobiales bacterium]
PWGTFLTNHDQNRAMSQLNGDVAQAKLAASAMLTMPGLPFIYYGEEIGMTGAKPDPLIRTPMQWRAGPSGGFTTGTPWQPVASLDPAATVFGQEGDPDSLLRHYRALVQLHAAHPALGHGDFIELDTNDSAVLAFLRVATDETVLVLINFGDEPIGDLTLALDADDMPGGDVTLETLFGEAGSHQMTLSEEDAALLFALDAQSTRIFELVPR